MVVTCHVGPGNWIQDSGRAASALHLSGLLLFVFEIGVHYVADWPEELVLQVGVTTDFCPSLFLSFLAVLGI